jgi:hypothetical protein
MNGKNQPDDFPYPGMKVLSMWIADQVKFQFQVGATTNEILKVVRDVLDNHEKMHGARPTADARADA